VRVEADGGRISADEMVSMVFLLLEAGSETTTHLISGSVYELLKNPSLRASLEQDWSRLPLAVEEFLRFVSPVRRTKIPGVSTCNDGPADRGSAARPCGERARASTGGGIGRQRTALHQSGRARRVACRRDRYHSWARFRL
jgi:hypothetical protein